VGHYNIAGRPPANRKLHSPARVLVFKRSTMSDQAYCALGLLKPPDVAFYMVAAFITNVAILRVEEAYERDFATRFDAIDRAELIVGDRSAFNQRFHAGLKRVQGAERKGRTPPVSDPQRAAGPH